MEFFYQAFDGDIMVLSIDGGLDSSNAREFGDKVQTLVDAGHTRLILDATKLTYISSLGVAVLLRLHGKMKPLGGDVKLANLHGTTWDVISLFQLDKVFSVFPSVDDAKQAFGEAG
ncbi:MAG: STAS domain-containing protein [Planctomycetota bacterium]